MDRTHALSITRQAQLLDSRTGSQSIPLSATQARDRSTQSGVGRRHKLYPIGVLRENKIRLSMDGKGRWRDHVFVERLWRSVKYEEVYLHAYESVSAARNGIARYMQFFNTRCLPSALDRRTPDTVYSLHYRSRWQLDPQSSTYRCRENCLVLWGHLSAPIAEPVWR
jgi:transposase InsO family protein